ncbi:hypothetical protein [Marinoscillum pacificum]|uniref:hypothetical protein n=1 Tax=Marinoscillum pacificum TaxID=392723 RepID=UPI002158370D|nr:hypothetical protein [Marinoscillum pacificum]
MTSTKKYDYKHRLEGLYQVEIDLISSLEISEDYFYQLFGDIVLSEVLPNSINVGKYQRETSSGILFCGEKIDLNQILEIKTELAKLNLVFECSFDEMLNSRYIDFEFPEFSDRDLLIEINKNYYKIYPIKDRVEFYTQVQFPNRDKSPLKRFCDSLAITYGAFPLWADGKENLLYCPMENSDDLVDLVYNFKDLIYPKEHGILNGWYTEQSLKEDIKSRLPLIDFGFYQ